MADLVQEFGSFLNQYELSKPAGLLQALLDQMDAEKAKQFKLCAIPHQFDSGILQALVPGLPVAKAATFISEFSQLPVVTFNGDGLALHDKARRHLFDAPLDTHKAVYAEALKRALAIATGPRSRL